MIRTVLIVSLLAACASPLQRFESERVVMGTKARIVFYASEDGAAARAFLRIAELEAVMSDYRDHSEVMQLCRKSRGTPMVVSDDLFRVLSAARRVSEQSDGAFDVTIGPLTHRWRNKEPATEADRALVGWRHLVLDRGRTVTLRKRGMIIDLGGIGKGFAADEALRELRRHGVTRALVDVGGDIALGGPPPDKEGWRINVAGKIRILANTAVAASGHTERPGHILDPRTGKSTPKQLRVTVLASDCTRADAWASALSVMGREGFYPPGLEVIFQAELSCQTLLTP